ncbi:MAG: hypothetical protein LKF96_05820 [Treponema sp.]|jgi:hypothetical protein|nr:hypothetical protein [Treponema sp.]
MINIENESSLHRELKQIYSLNDGFKTEVPAGKWICDILSDNKEIIEIQTANLSKLTAKVKGLLALGYSITVVYPLAVKKYIETYTPDGKLVQRRKSPKKYCIYDLFRELTGIYPLLLNTKFTLEVPEVTLCEKRIDTGKPVQVKNKSRTFLKNWYKYDKTLEEVGKSYFFRTQADYISLIPEQIRQNFCAKTLAAELKKEKKLPARVVANVNLIIWVLYRMNIIQQNGIYNRSHYYKIAE